MLIFTMPNGSACEDSLTCNGMVSIAHEPTDAAHRKKRKSTWDKHTQKRPGTSPPPNYVPYRKFQQPPDKDREKPPYFRKDRDTPPGSGGEY